MFYLKKRIEISSSHALRLSYESKCTKIHGHNWIITVFCRRAELNEHGMIIDFSEIKRIVNQLDHAYLNTIVFQPTAENIAKFVCDNILHCYRVDVQESEGNTVCYIK